MKDLAIRGIGITHFRGIERGEVAGLGRMTVITGAPGNGKSTVLDALLLAYDPMRAASTVIPRGRHDAPRPAPRSTGLEVYEITPTGNKRAVRLSLDPEGLLVGTPGHPSRRVVHDNPSARRWVLIDSELPRPLAESFSQAARGGRAPLVLAFLRKVLADPSADLEIQVGPNGGETLHLITDHQPVPVRMADAALQAALRMAIMLATNDIALAAVDMPDLQLRPHAQRLTARALWGAVRRGIQVAVTTRSVEFISRLEEEAGRALPTMVLQHLTLENGHLSATRFAAADIPFARQLLQAGL